MENGNAIPLSPELGTLVTLHVMPTSPMAKLGKSAAAEVMRMREFLNMLSKSVRVVRGNLTTRLGCLRWRKSYKEVSWK